MNEYVIKIADPDAVVTNTSNAFRVLNDLYYDRPGFFTYMFNTHKYRQWQRQVAAACCAVRDGLDMQYMTEWAPMMKVLRILEAAVAPEMEWLEDDQ